MDAWYGLYVWSGGTAARMTEAQPASAEGLDQREPPLWYQWRETGLGPEGGFVTARMDPEIPAGARRPPVSGAPGAGNGWGAAGRELCLFGWGPGLLVL